MIEIVCVVAIVLIVLAFIVGILIGRAGGYNEGFEDGWNEAHLGDVLPSGVSPFVRDPITSAPLKSAEA